MQVSHWKVAAVSVRGTGHEQTGTPCQDACSTLESEDGRWVALVASDGAGSAKHSDVSSALIASDFANALIRIAKELDYRPPGAWVTDAVIEEIVRLRKVLREKAGSDNISDFHCTLVAALLGATGGFAIHLGDGAVFGGIANSSDETNINLSDEYFVSEPENGEYANETVFLTERDWIKHLRIQPLSRAGWLILGTDGGMALAMVEDKAPKVGFVVPVLRGLISSSDSEARNDSLEKVLTDRLADRLTNDDKTLIIAVRSTYELVSGEFQVPVIKTAAKPPASSPTSPPLQLDSALPKNVAINSRPIVTALGPESQSREDSAKGLKRVKGKRVILSAVIFVLFAFLVVGIWLYLLPNPAANIKAIEKSKDATTAIVIDKKNAKALGPQPEESKGVLSGIPASPVPDSHVESPSK